MGTRSEELGIKLSQFQALTGIDFERAKELADKYGIDEVLEITKSGHFPLFDRTRSIIDNLSQKHLCTAEQLWEVAKIAERDFNHEVLAILIRFARLTNFGYSFLWLYKWLVKGDNLEPLYGLNVLSNPSDQLKEIVRRTYYGGDDARPMARIVSNSHFKKGW